MLGQKDTILVAAVAHQRRKHLGTHRPVDFGSTTSEFVHMPRHVREPIQTYLSEAERETLDRVAAGLGISRSEALRRGIQALGEGRYAGELRTLVDAGVVTPPTLRSDEPPPRLPVAPLSELLEELTGDRDGR